MNRSVRLILTFAAISMILQITVGNSPALPPYGQYFIRGRITRPAGLPLDNFVVTLLGEFRQWAPRDTAVALDPFRRRTDMDQYPAVTDTAGNFFLVVATGITADSVALQVSAVGLPTVRGPLIAVPSTGIPVTVIYSENRPGCSDCSSNSSTTTTVTKGYQYYLPDQTLVLAQ